MKISDRPVRDTIPVNLIIGGSSVLVVGGGKVGERKARGLLDCGASVELVCPVATDGLVALAQDGKVDATRIRRGRREGQAMRLCVH